MEKLNFTEEDLKKWSLAVAEAGTRRAVEEIAKRIWEDGYRTAEAEIIYKEVGL